MSNYERNNTMVACVIAFIILGGVVVGVLVLGGNFSWSPWPPSINVPDWENGTLFEFERSGVAVPDDVAVGFTVATGFILVTFVDDPNLTYAVSMWVPNATLAQHGDPIVSWASNTVTSEYPVGRVNITLGTNATYTLDLDTTAGAITIILDHMAHVVNMNTQTTTGTIALTMTDDIVVNGAADFTLEATTGGIIFNIDLPTNVGGQFSADVTTGSVNISPTGWSSVGTNIYETSDYNTATNTVTISATTTTGQITGSLS
jgi:hypothetical protein